MKFIQVTVIITIFMLFALRLSVEMELIVPLYRYPDSQWILVGEAAANISVTAIINPNSGPVVDPDAIYQEYIPMLLSKGVTVIGYIDTNYGYRAMPDVIHDIKTYYNWTLIYRVQGIYFDRASNNAAVVRYYRILYAFTKDLFGCNGKIITGQGINTPEIYLDEIRTADSAVIFENDFNTWINKYQPDAYVSVYETIEFSAIIYQALSLSKMNMTINTAINRNIDLIYVTDYGPPNPYRELPSYFKDLVDMIASI